MSPDTVPPLYPDRPIRPLPKRRLRERLSPAAAESIKYPPAPVTTTPLFYYPYTITEDVDARGGLYPVDRQRADEIERNYISRRNGDEADSDEEYHDLPYRGRFQRQTPEASSRSYRYVQKPESSKYSKPEPPGSTTSSADGYESFENTNNKKKRKIPTPGDAGLNGIHLSNDLASLGISPAGDEASPRDDSGNGVGQYYGTGSSTISPTGQGISGPGRGRYGRVRNGRSPLRTLSDGPNNWANGRNSKQRQSQYSPNEATGIISTAIANAEKLPVTSSRGQENISLLQQASKKSSPVSAQFTFTCDSQVPGTVLWPGLGSSINMHQSPAARGIATNTHGTQTSPKALAFSAKSRPPFTSAELATATSHTPKQIGKQAAPVKKIRRRTGKEYLIAARQRREQQEYQNYLHPPAPEDEWICEFCEYERIFGAPPEALIRQYEIKDRRVKKKEEERRRLLEKAKMKGRKGKKGGKPATKNVGAAHDRQPQPQQTQQAPSMNPSQSQSQGTQSEEYYEDDYDEEFAQDEPLPPTAPVVTRRQDGAPLQTKKRATLQGESGHSEHKCPSPTSSIDKRLNCRGPC